MFHHCNILLSFVSLTLACTHLVYMHIYTFVYTMHRVESGAKVLQQVGVSHFAVTCRKTHTASSQSLLLALCAHGLLSRAGMPQTCHSDTCWPLLFVGSSFGGMREKTPGGRLLGRVTILPAVLDGCWQANKESSARSRRVWEPCCQ